MNALLGALDPDNTAAELRSLLAVPHPQRDHVRTLCLAYLKVDPQNGEDDPRHAIFTTDVFTMPKIHPALGLTAASGVTLLTTVGKMTLGPRIFGDGTAGAEQTSDAARCHPSPSPGATGRNTVVCGQDALPAQPPRYHCQGDAVCHPHGVHEAWASRDPGRVRPGCLAARVRRPQPQCALC